MDMTTTTVEKKNLERGFRLGDFLVEPELQRVTAPDRKIQVEPRVMQVLLLMAAQAGRTVTKERFMDEVWGDTVVTEDALLRCISELRKMFDDDPREPEYIETIRKKGYRLIAPVTLLHDEAGIPIVHEKQEPYEEPQRGTRWHLIWAVVSLSAVAIVVAVALIFPSLKRPAMTPLSAVPLTSYTGEETDPNISPDGDRVAFVWNGGEGEGAPLDIYVKQVGRATAFRLTASPDDDLSPTWSPDGQSLAFVRKAEEEFAIYTKPALGGSERRLTGMGSREIRSMSWSPDGQTLALSIRKAPTEPFVVSELDMESLEERILTSPPADYTGDLKAVYAPNGRQIAFSRRVMEKVDDIFVIPAAGGAPTRITFDHTEISGFDWMPAGRDLVFTSDREGSSALWRVAVTGSSPQWIPTSGEGTGAYQPSVARKSGRLVFVQRSIETNLWRRSLVPGDTTSPSPIITSTRMDGDPDISPHGRLVFISNRLGNDEVWMSEKDGSEPAQVTSLGGTFTSNPRWSPDGERLAFVAHSEGHADIYVIRAAGGQPKRITTAESNDREPNWSRDGLSIYFASNRSGRWEIWRRPVEDGEAEQITTNGGFAAMESMSGDTLYFVKRDVPGIWQMPLAGPESEEERIIEELAPLDWGNWSVGENAIYYILREADRPRLRRFDLTSGETTTLVALHNLPKRPSMAVTPEGDAVVYTRMDRRDSDILMIDELR